MTDDATLSDFSSPGSDAGTEADESDTSGESDESSESSKAPTRADEQTDDELERDTIEEPQHTVEAPRTTFAWGSYTCGHCEAATERAWRVDGEFVCPACKPW
ncbi:DUF7573 domain-containing protein [Natronorubrum daqingense]|uniref:DUF7573 domain-containing protein n=1 Tax=Natronorubrum daqingense TaxID=588898 RepID=A0A1N7G8A9_9EURY|nr:hypothetical protein [Natronorubrum daqingense]APX97269.1 hypothetical protein BB347_11930 [Natronorubrum daqingense]SIS08744.1 hypothetical protein SAMN05421809_3788 [Natronorubrum daqingense]